MSELVKDKYVVFRRPSGQVDRYECFENFPTLENRILSRWKLIWKLLTGGWQFQRLLGETIKYAMRHSESYRGKGAAEAMFFSSGYKGYNQIWEKKK